jgi:hypothetical protein
MTSSWRAILTQRLISDARLRTTPNTARVDLDSRQHREVFLRRGKVGLYTNWVEFTAHAHYNARGRCGAIPGEKAVFVNPRTRYEDIDQFIAAARD